MGKRCSKERHKPIAEELVDGAFIAVDFVKRQFEEPIQQGMHVFGTQAFGNRSRVCQITKQYGDLFPFAFERTPGGQNFLSKVFGRVGQGFAFLIWGWSRGEGWDARDRGLR
jgi:hypothetical protein